MIIFEEISSLIVAAIKAVLSKGNRRIRIIFFSAWGLIFLAIILVSIAEAYGNQFNWMKPIGAGMAIIGASSILGIGFHGRALTSSEREKAIKAVEEKARENPHETQAAWVLAKVNLENYLNRNLQHIRWIFSLTLFVMFSGFAIIGYGVFQVYHSPEYFKPSIVVTVSGVIVEFIAATFLIIYKSTMDQARSYVTMLEKINAVGMSLQILDSLKAEDRDKYRVQIALELLSLYSMRGNTRKRTEDNL